MQAAAAAGVGQLHLLTPMLLQVRLLLGGRASGRLCELRQLAPVMHLMVQLLDHLPFTAEHRTLPLQLYGIMSHAMRRFPSPLIRPLQALHHEALAAASEADLMAAISSSLAAPGHGASPEVESARCGGGPISVRTTSAWPRP
jgi:hypothetical protein